jgi:type VI secretion system secreted protein VgrG
MLMPSDQVNVTLGAPGWNVTGGTLRERLSEPFIATLELGSEVAELDPTSLLGSSQEIVFSRGGFEQRACGIVTAVRERHDLAWRSRASITVEPALAALRYRRDSRIFQQMTVPQILDRVLGEGLGRFGRETQQVLTRVYPPREYTVQYQESDFDFASRLMEEEGIVYFFVHDGARETMVLVDRNASHPALEGASASLVNFADSNATGVDRVRVFEQLARITGTRVSTQHFDWTHPTMPITAGQGAEAVVDFESYFHDAPITYHDYAHAYGANNASDQTELLRQLQARDARVFEGDGSVVALRAGTRFDLVMHPKLELNQAYLVVAVEHRFVEDSGGEDETSSYTNVFECVPAEVQWRPDRRHARPRVASIQTATVVCPPGEEIHTDEHGRVKVQFHWDRLGRRDEQSSCWIRVGQAMGGDGWGFTFVPRVNMEVIVAFIEGDIDRPLITGVVYNTRNPPPVNLPADKTRTTIKSNSSPGGGGNNELRLEDKAGQEEIYLHGHRDWNTTINNDHTRSVGNNETQSVGVNRSRTVGVNEDCAVGVDRTHVIGNNETQIVGTDRTRTVGNDEAISVGKDRTKKIGKNEKCDIGKNKSEKVGGKLTQAVKKTMKVSVGLAYMQTVGLSHVVNVGAMAKKNVVGSDSWKVGLNLSIQSGMATKIKVGTNMSLKVKGTLDESVKTRVTKIETSDTLNTDTQAITVAGAHSLTAASSTNTISGAYCLSAATYTANIAGMAIVTVPSYTIACAANFTVICGGSKLVLTPGGIVLETTGTLTLKGAPVDMEGKGGTNIKAAGGAVDIKGGPFIKLNS